LLVCISAVNVMFVTQLMVMNVLLQAEKVNGHVYTAYIKRLHVDLQCSHSIMNVYWLWICVLFLVWLVSFFLFDMVGGKKGWQSGLIMSALFILVSLIGFKIVTNYNFGNRIGDFVNGRNGSLRQTSFSFDPLISFCSAISMENPLVNKPVKKDNSIQLSDLEKLSDLENIE